MYIKVMFFYVDAKWEKTFEEKSKCLQFIQRTSIFTHYIQNSRRYASKYMFYKTLVVVYCPDYLLKKR